MTSKAKTLYLWDLAGTLFPEEWNKEKSGFETYKDYVVSLGKNPDNPCEWAESEKETYLKDWYNLGVAPYFRETLKWTKYNETFSTGVPEAMDWRAAYLNPRVGFDIQSYFQKINSTFDYGETNTKTKEMLIDYMQKKYDQEYKTIVCTDDKQKNLDAFKEAAEEIKKNHPDFSYRLYYILNDNNGLRKEKDYFIVGNLFDLLENKKKSHLM